jgi:penicillin-binding protein 2
MFERRLRLFLLFIFFGAFLLAARAAQVQVLQRGEWVARANDDVERPTYINARRGDLLDFKGRVIATDVPSFEASVNFRVLGEEPDARWFKQETERRARKQPGWADADDDQRLLMVAEQQQGVRNDLADMWTTLAALAGKTPEAMNELRKELVQDVQDKHKQYVNRRFGAATREYQEAPETPWYARLIVGNPRPPEASSFEKELIGDQLGFHVILPDLPQEQYNALSLAQERFPLYKPDSAPWTSVLKLGPAVRRQYPFEDVACQVIGHVGVVSAEDRARDVSKEDELRRYALVDRIGRDGLEYLAEQQLRGTRGTKYADRRGANLRAEEATPGQDVRTTIDIQLQRDIQEAFKTVNFQTPDVDPNDPTGRRHIVDVLPMNGAAVIIDVKTGQVRALVSVPTFDLNRFDELYESMADDNLNRPMTNRALLDAIEPGSTVKPIVGLGAVTQKLITALETVECTGFPIINGRRLDKPRCWTESIYGKLGLGAHHVVPYSAPHANGFLDLTDAIERSCNVYFETQGYKLGLPGLSYWMRRFGYDRPTGIGLPEARGLVPDRAKIDPTERGSAPLYASIGQSTVLATPIQVANEMATIARDGIWQRPTLLVNPPAPSTRPADPDAIPDRYDLHLDPTAVRAVHEGMIKVVNSKAGTGTQVRNDSVLVAAKTGSATASPLIRFVKDDTGAQVVDEKGRALYNVIEYGRHDAPNPLAPWYRMSGVDDNGKPKGTHSWVAGYFPADGEPELAFAVYVEYGGSGGIGAGSVVNKLVESCIRNGYVKAKPAVKDVAMAGR